MKIINTYSYKFSLKFDFITFLFFSKNKNHKSMFQQVGGRDKNNQKLYIRNGYFIKIIKKYLCPNILDSHFRIHLQEQ